MQLNPARGRKRLRLNARIRIKLGRVYAAQPREGTETPTTQSSQPPIVRPGLCSSTPRGDGNRQKTTMLPIGVNHKGFMQLNLARGRKLPRSTQQHARNNKVYAAQPREGTETRPHRPLQRAHCALGLCSSTPRGDGNKPSARRHLESQDRFMQLNPARGRKHNLVYTLNQNYDEVYAAQPREGTETIT